MRKFLSVISIFILLSIILLALAFSKLPFSTDDIYSISVVVIGSLFISTSITYFINDFLDLNEL